MKEEWMDKEVLCIFDTRQIQRFMFRSNSYLDTLGGNDMLDDFLEKAIEYAVTHIDPPLAEDEYDLSRECDIDRVPYFVTDRVRFQIFVCAAGNAMAIVRTGRLCQKIIRKISRYYLDHAYSLNLTAAVTEKTDDLAIDMFNLYENLDAIKASSDILDPMETLPVIMREVRTGNPVTGFDKENGDYVSKASIMRRKKAGERKLLYGMNELPGTKWYDGKKYVAVIHSDGNNMGLIIGKIQRSTPNYEEGIITRRRIDKNIKTIYTGVLKKTLQELEDYYVSRGGKREEFVREFMVFHQAGDDINCMCSADLAFPFLGFFYKNLEGSTFWDEGGIRAPMYMCTGIAFVPPEDSFHAAYLLAEECCNSAKKTAKSEEHLRDGYAGNWVDFQICENAAKAQHLELLRERVFCTDEQISLLLRPYCFDKEEREQPYSWEKLCKRVQAMRELDLDADDMEKMRLSYSVGRNEFARWVQKMKKQGTDLAEKCGKPLFLTDAQTHKAVWFDTAELLPFFERTAAEQEDEDKLQNTRGKQA